MGLISLLWGIAAMLWMVLALVPLLGWMNWFLIAFAAVGAVIAAIGMALTGLSAFLVWVWPTPYEYYDWDGAPTLPHRAAYARRNRLTGESQERTPDRAGG